MPTGLFNQFTVSPDEPFNEVASHANDDGGTEGSFEFMEN